jgi:Lar family restriction alleviation protein
MTELKPCPFCGEKAIIDATDTSGGQLHYWVKCCECGAQPYKLADYAIPKEDAIELWNIRADDDRADRFKIATEVALDALNRLKDCECQGGEKSVKLFVEIIAGNAILDIRNILSSDPPSSAEDKTD